MQTFLKVGLVAVVATCLGNPLIAHAQWRRHHRWQQQAQIVVIPPPQPPVLMAPYGPGCAPGYGEGMILPAPQMVYVPVYPMHHRRHHHRW